ncbi:MAG: zinc-dependent alcohol dehydrogenase [Alphaproteobacteria bacterium]
MAEQGQAAALWYAAPGKAEWRSETLPALPPGHCRVRTLFSALSRGTESLVFHGKVPESERDRMRAPMMAGDFPFPVKYGYAAVGLVEDGPKNVIGKAVFALHPHQDLFDVAPDQAAFLPEGLPPQRGILAANMETALNALWDSGATAGQRIAVIGGGVVGLLVGYLAARLPGAEVTLVDLEPKRAALARALGMGFTAPASAPQHCDVAFHASGVGAGLNTAIACAGDEATVIEMSWYGEGQVPVALGGAFHSRRLILKASQVGKVAPNMRPRWSYGRRLAMALDLLRDARLDALLEAPITAADLPARLPDILKPGGGVLCQPIAYPVS